MKVRLIAILGILIFAVSASAAPGDETPQWVQQAATIKVPDYEKDVPAVVLVDDQTTTIGSDGHTTEVYNYAVRILRREGREYAVAHVGYLPDVGKVKEFRAWLIRPGSEAKRYGKDDTLDVAATRRTGSAPPAGTAGAGKARGLGFLTARRSDAVRR